MLCLTVKEDAEELCDKAYNVATWLQCSEKLREDLEDCPM